MCLTLRKYLQEAIINFFSKINGAKNMHVKTQSFQGVVKNFSNEIFSNKIQLLLCKQAICQFIKII